MIELKKNEREIIRIQTSTFNEKKYTDIRVFYQDKKTKAWLPSRKGITLNPTKIKEFIGALCDYSEKEGAQ